jgi:hypothetical protein
MKPIPAFALILAAVALTAADAPKPAKGAKSADHKCFWARNVTSFEAADDTHVNIRVGARDVYAMTLFAPCPEVDWAHRVALKSRGSNYICSALDAELITPSSLGRQRCAIREIRYLTPAEVAQLPKHARP